MDMDPELYLEWLSTSSEIKRFRQTSRSVTLDYFVFGHNPRLFISSGMHGNEYKVISSVSRAIKDNLHRLPSFIYIPVATPSAVKAKTRENQEGQDVNRGFVKNSKVEESKIIMKILEKCKLDLSVSFHEDLEFLDFYMYDNLGIDENRDILSLLSNFKKDMLKLKVGLLNGIDDPSDPDLGYEFIEGYRPFPYDSNQKEDGQLETWNIRNGISKRSLNPEVPDRLNQQTKDDVVAAVFKNLVIPFLNKY